MNSKSILDPEFHYVRALETDVAATWKRFGFDPRRNSERRTRWRGEVPDGEPTARNVRRSTNSA
jgi:hypothetical protein